MEKFSLCLIVFSLIVQLCQASFYETIECLRSSAGYGYMGTVNTTMSGWPCQSWQLQTPHAHNYTNPLMFADRNWDEISNNCRNPTLPLTEVVSFYLDEGAWCFVDSTDDDAPRWEYCDVPLCDAYPSCSPLTQPDADTLSMASPDEEVDSTIASQPNLKVGKWKLRMKTSQEKPNQKSTQPSSVGSEEVEKAAAICKPSAACTTSHDGAEYVGKQGLTVSGRPCQRWDRQFPHTHNYTNSDQFPDESVTAAENFCRNPGSARDGPWCLTTDADVVWEYCGVPVCTDCKKSPEGTEYAGNKSTTISGLTCQRWDSQTPHKHQLTDPDRYPDASLVNAKNYCRNPDGKKDGLWCFTEDPDVIWEYCDLGFCNVESQYEDQSKRNIKHVLHIGIDGLHQDCWLNAPGGAPNFKRFMNQGSYNIKSARTVIQTFSGPGWASQICAMGVDFTGTNDNYWKAPWMGFEHQPTPITGTGYPMPCVFNRLKGLDENMRTASFLAWPWPGWFTNKGTPGSTDVDTGCGVFYSISKRICDTTVTSNATEYLANITQRAERSYTFVHLDSMDGIGHSRGWCGEQYLEKFDFVDSLVGEMLDAVEEQPVLVVLSSDHGGHDRGHGSQVDEDLNIPMFLMGPGVKAGYEMKKSVRNMDIVPTVVWAMGYEPAYQWYGKVMYEAFGSFS